MKKPLKNLLKWYGKANALLANNILAVLLVAASLMMGGVAVALTATSHKAPQSQSTTSTNSTTSQPQTALTNSSSQSPQTTTNNASSNTNHSSTTTPTNTYTSNYKAPVCTKTPIPYQTTYFLATWMGAGEVKVQTQGQDGYTEVCTADSNGYTPSPVPLNAVTRLIDVGDGGGSLEVMSQPQSTPYDEAYARALPACDNLMQLTNNDPAAKQWCLNNVVAGIMHYYGY